MCVLSILLCSSWNCMKYGAKLCGSLWFYKARCLEIVKNDL